MSDEVGEFDFQRFAFIVLALFFIWFIAFKPIGGNWAGVTHLDRAQWDCDADSTGNIDIDNILLAVEGSCNNVKSESILISVMCLIVIIFSIYSAISLSPLSERKAAEKKRLAKVEARRQAALEAWTREEATRQAALEVENKRREEATRQAVLEAQKKRRQSGGRILEVKGLNGGYGSVQILYDIDLYVDKGEFVTIIGPNGCGKSTLIKTIFGIATHYSGSVVHNGDEVSGWRTDQLVNRGIAYVPQVNNVFPSLTVHENLQMGGNKLPTKLLNERIERALNMFPDLRDRTHDLAASLSGGERQMLAISRALISNPTFLLLDEPTAALSPLYQQQIIERIDSLRSEGITVLIVEQNARLSLARSDRGYILASGKVVHTSDAQHILTDPEIGEYFLGSH